MNFLRKNRTRVSGLVVWLGAVVVAMA